MIEPSAFKIVCVNCGALGITLDLPANAPASLQINCSHCKTPRGTLGDLRALACSAKRFDVQTTEFISTPEIA